MLIPEITLTLVATTERFTVGVCPSVCLSVTIKTFSEQIRHGNFKLQSLATAIGRYRLFSASRSFLYTVYRLMPPTFVQHPGFLF